MDIFLGTLFIVVCILLVIVVLLQRGRGGGLGAAFGGAGSSAFGTRTGDVFTWVTIVLTALFLLLAIGSTMLWRPEKVQVADPTFDPAAMGISEPVEVKLGDVTPGATIHYTIGDKSVADPTEKDAIYQQVALKVQPGQTIKARAFVKGGKPSNAVKAEYPKAAPTITTSAPTAQTSSMPTSASAVTAESMPTSVPTASAPVR